MVVASRCVQQPSDAVKLRIRSITWEADDIRSFELVNEKGDILPPFAAGAHLEFRTPNGMRRHYSLCNPPSERHRYVVAVLDLPCGRGGSHSMHEQLRAGDMIDAAGPYNYFRLDENAKHSVLLAGGIGITPIMAMRAALSRSGRSYELHYCARNANRTAFLGDLATDLEAGRAKLHFDDGDPSRGINLSALLNQQIEGTHLYYCGPVGFMAAVREASKHWREGTVHYEYFGANPTVEMTKEGSSGDQTIVLERRGLVIELASNQTVLEAVRGAGVEAESSCEAGMCGTCKVRYSGGTPRHNDFILSDDEREEYVIICCATVEEGPLVLDI